MKIEEAPEVHTCPKRTIDLCQPQVIAKERQPLLFFYVLYIYVHKIFIIFVCMRICEHIFQMSVRQSSKRTLKLRVSFPRRNEQIDTHTYLHGKVKINFALCIQNHFDYAKISSVQI